MVSEDILVLELKVNPNKAERDRLIGQCAGYSREWTTWAVIIDSPSSAIREIDRLITDKGLEQIVIWPFNRGFINMSLDSLPEEGESQRIGRMAVKAFEANIPNNWLRTELSGDTDFGVDYFIQVKNPQGQIWFSFNFQLKGSLSPSLINNGTHYSFPFKVSTLNYYRNQEKPVMVALVDLSKDLRPKNCNIYYMWLDEDFLDSIKVRREANDTVSIHIPVSDEITDDLDISQYCKKRLLKSNALHGLYSQISTIVDDPVSKISDFARALQEKPILVFAVSEDSGCPWIENPENHISGALKKINDLINLYNSIEATRLLETVEEKILEITPHEQAEYFLQKARLLMIEDESEMAHSNYLKANELMQTSRYRVAYVESMIRTERNEEIDILSLPFATGGFSEKVLLAKLYALKGEISKAISILNECDYKKVSVYRLMVYIIGGDIDKVEEIIDGIEVESLSIRERFVYCLLVSRFYFFKSIEDSGEGNIPLWGKRSYDWSLLKKSLMVAIECWQLAAQLNYPYDVKLLIDYSRPLFSLFNKTNFLIRILTEMVEGRKKGKIYSAFLIELLFNSQEYENALRYIQQQHDKSDLWVIEIFCCFNLKNSERVIELAQVNINLLISGFKDVEKLLLMASLSCHRTLQSQQEAVFIERLKELVNSEEVLAYYEFSKKIDNNPLRLKEYVIELSTAIEQLEISPHLIDLLFSKLDAKDLNQAEKIVLYSEKMSETDGLSLWGNFHLAQAYITLSKWKELYALCDIVVEQSHEDISDWVVMRALALDGLGLSSEAIQILQGALASKKFSLNVLKCHADICFRTGFIDEAVESFEATFAKTSKREEKLHSLYSLCFLHSKSSDSNDKLLAVIKRLGEIVNKENEQEEGTFLVNCLMTDFSDDYHFLTHVRSRIESYLNSFPDSKILKARNIDQCSTSEDLIAMLNDLIGETENTRNEKRKNREALRDGTLCAPFVFIPKLLDDVSDVFHLWAISKLMGYNKPEYKMVSNVDVSSIEKYSIDNAIPLLDETALLALNELALFDKLFIVFEKIAVSKLTIKYFGMKAHCRFGSPYSSIPNSIISKLTEYSDRIIYVGNERENYSPMLYEELISKYPNLFIFADDYCIRLIASHKTGCLMFSSFHLIELLHSKEQISGLERVEYLEALSILGWKGIKFSLVDVANCFMASLIKAPATNILESRFKSVFDVFFSPLKGFDNMLSEFIGFVDILIERNDFDKIIEQLHSVIELWCIRVALTNAKNISEISLQAVLFIKLCENKEPLFLYKELSLPSTYHARAWNIFNESVQRSFSRNHKTISNKFIIDVVAHIVILISNNTSRGRLYRNILSCFSDGTEISDLFKEAYTRERLQKRSDTPINQILDLSYLKDEK